MPLTRIDLRRGKSMEYRRAIMEQVYAAMRETFDVPDEDRFMILTEHDADTISCGERELVLRQRRSAIRHRRRRLEAALKRSPSPASLAT